MDSRHVKSSHAHQMFEMVERFLESRFSQTEFCHQHEIAYWTFRYWLKKYQAHKLHQRPNTSESEPGSAFVPVRIQPPETVRLHSSSCVIEYPNGVLVRLSGAVDAQLVAELIHHSGL